MPTFLIRIIVTNERLLKLFLFFFLHLGRVGLTTPDKGVSDMTSIPDIDEIGINRNLKVRYERDEIYVSKC
jgi:hypothetical protein